MVSTVLCKTLLYDHAEHLSTLLKNKCDIIRVHIETSKTLQP